MGNACDGKVALVAGASQGGTGTATAIRLAAEGAKVAICARTVAKLEETLAAVRAVGGDGVVFECDLAEPSGGRDTLIARTEEALGPIDHLIYVAARATYAKFESITPQRLQRDLEVNFKAPWLLSQQAIASMRARGAHGAVVNIGSKAARPIQGPPFADVLPVSAGSLYGSTKAALHRCSQSVAAETYGEGISVNVLSPLAAIATPFVTAGGWIPPELCEPVETMAEAVLALVTGDPMVLTGRDACSILLLQELQRPVRDLAGEDLVEGWQPEDLGHFVERVSRQG